MAVTYLGSKSLGAACIAIGLALPALTESLNDLLSRIAALEAQVTANLSLIASLPDPVELAKAIAAAAAEAVAKIGDIIANIPGPLLEANISLGADVAALVALQLSLKTLVTTLSAAASAGGVHCFSIDSTPANVGTELAALVGGGIAGGSPTAQIRGCMFITESPATFAVMSSVLLV